ncbi:hypothetical protein GCK72_012749 [Caenorhabditis remanei]|uniref:CUT domain-containing protein n=1 Tax=Caenorhabditis remanei TaxID=31234 RepID=A0A6A5GP74_CAERE|nr:hypothetical protein GCK72_012749 [Caenorhabditis remanei]KAF1756296.1 hypothetical protein GCK72_012749 [Caenorhabditis remanei]
MVKPPDQHDAEPTFTTLTKVKTVATDRKLQAVQEARRCIEREMIFRNAGKRIRGTPYGSKDFPIYFAFQNENLEDYEIVSIGEQKSGEWSPIGANGNHEPNGNNLCHPLTNTPTSSSSPLSTSSFFISAQQANEMLSKPIPNEIEANTKKISLEMKIWFSLEICSQSYFAVKILNVDRGRLHSLMRDARDFNTLKSGKDLYTRMYNWLKLSSGERDELLKMDLFGNHQKVVTPVGGSVVTVDENVVSAAVVEVPDTHNEVDLYEDEYILPSDPSFLPKPDYIPMTSYSRSPPYSSPSPPLPPSVNRISADTAYRLLNNPIDYVDTYKIAAEILDWLKTAPVSRDWFAGKILNRTKRTLSDIIKHPRDWKDLNHRTEYFIKMYNWLNMSEEQRLQIMHCYGARPSKSQYSFTFINR